MGKWAEKTLEQSDTEENENHVAVEDIARLAEGSVDTREREILFRHINRCQRCYQILHHTLQDVQDGAAGPRWKAKTIIALAASIFLIFVISGQLIYKYWSRTPVVLSTTLDLDQSLKEVLLEDDALKFGKGARLDRLLALFQEKGLGVKNLKFAVLSKPYYQKKSLFGPREILHIRIENDVAYLEVKEMETD